jgi:O-antigen ligase
MCTQMDGMDRTIVRNRNQRRGVRWTSPASPNAGSPKTTRVKILLMIGLWGLLWGGYNTDYSYAQSPLFPSDLTYFIHGTRAFLPFLAAWISLLILLTHANQVMRWIMGPVGLILLYACLGLASSVTISELPTESIYWGVNYLSIVLVMLAILSLEYNLADLSRLLVFNWIIAVVLTVGMLGAVPFLGRPSVAGADSDAYTEMAVRTTYSGGGQILGMASSRNTGFARYAAISALAALARFRTGSRTYRIVWAIIFLISTYALILSNGRTEVFSFIIAALLVMYADKSKRVLYTLAGIAFAILLGLKGFYSAFYLYFTRTGHFDFTMTGRTLVWQEGLRLLNQSPWVGLGFQADRIYLRFQHMHNAFLSAMIQSGVIGAAAIFLALGMIGYLVAKYFFLRPLRNKDFIPAEVPGIFVFVIVSSVAESTFAYFSAAWLLSAPIVIYVLTLHRQVQQSVAVLAKGREGGLASIRARRKKELSAIPDAIPSPAPARFRHRR